ncbi:MAG TPA: succinate--CoA ligase subunit alpha [bacterium]|nr:succinate--CoA ligase subunit alpha [bacterium]
MSVLIDRRTKVVVWGITGYQGEFHTARMLEYGTSVVAGVTPGKGGQRVHEVPVFETGEEAVRETGGHAACLFVPAAFARDAVLEAVSLRLDPIVVITEGIPVHDTILFVTLARRQGLTIIGPNCPGLASAGESKIGIMPNLLFTPGSVGVVSRSGTLTYEIVAALTRRGIGQSTALGLGGDPVVGTTFTDALRMFQEDGATRAIVMIGEIGGSAEEDAAAFIRAHVTKPVVGYIAGRTAPPGKRMGHAGAVISGSAGTAEVKIEALRSARVAVATLPGEVAQLVAEVL